MDILSLLPTVYEKFIFFVLVFARISSLLSTFILFRRELITGRIIISLTAMLSIYVLLLDQTKSIPYELFSMAMMKELLFQAFIGFLAGLILNIVFEVFLVLGQIISTQIGLSLASLMDPRFGTITSLTQFYIITMSLIFLLLNGHLFVIKTIVESFQVLPLYQDIAPKMYISDVLKYSGIIFSGSLILSITIIIATMLTNMAFAVMTKFAPQFNIFSIGINITLLMGLFCIYLTFDMFVIKGSDFIKECMTFLSQSFLRLK